MCVGKQVSSDRWEAMSVQDDVNLARNNSDKQWVRCQSLKWRSFYCINDLEGFQTVMFLMYKMHEG